MRFRSEVMMPHIITEPCVGVCDTACVDVCPVDCIHPTKEEWANNHNVNKQLYIHPEECIDCGACLPECPVEAIFEEDDVPTKWKQYIQINADFYHR